MMINVADALKAARGRHGLTQEQVAERSGVGQGVISALESGKHPNPRVLTLVRLTVAFGKCPLDELVGRNQK